MFSIDHLANAREDVGVVHCLSLGEATFMEPRQSAFSRP
jgi:hypothetical protein